MQKINTALIGYGYWGPNHARIIDNHPLCNLKYIVELNKNLFKAAGKKHPKTIITSNLYKVLQDPHVQAIIVATPTKTHYHVASECLKAKKHILVEKPLTYKSNDSKKLIELSKKNHVILMVGHTFLYNNSVLFIKNVIDKGKLGKIRHLHFQRRSLGPIRKDVNVLWDLAPHDIAIILFFIKSKVKSVIATGANFLRPHVPDVVNASIKFDNGCIANIILSWIDPIKIRDITIVGDKKMLLFDDVKIDDKITIFDKNANIITKTTDVSYDDYQVEINIGKEEKPQITPSEPLSNQFDHFVNSIIENKIPISDGNNGLKVVEILELLQKSLDNNSKIITIKQL